MASASSSITTSRARQDSSLPSARSGAVVASTHSADGSVHVLYFAALRDLAGTSEEHVGMPVPLSVAALLSQLEDRHGQLRGRLGSVRVSGQRRVHELATLAARWRGGGAHSAGVGRLMQRPFTSVRTKMASARGSAR